MSHKRQKFLLPFYFGTVNENERLAIEREMLTDSEVLLDYLDLKRGLEGAHRVSPQPSQELFHNVKRKTFIQRKTLFSLSLGLAIAASLAFLLVFRPSPHRTEISRPTINGALFDSNSELSVSSGVL